MALNIALAKLIEKSVITDNFKSDKIITIGKLDLAIPPGDCKVFAKKFGVDFRDLPSKEGADLMLKKIFKCDKVDSLDVSDYEGCDIVHDLNYELNVDYHGKYDVLIDGGCLEHIYNVPVALNNYRDLLSDNGNLFISTMANNHMGHGFYQFSPELFFRYFCEKNGFLLKSVILVEHSYPTTLFSHGLKYFTVTDPSKLRKRVGLVSKRPVIILVHAIKKASKEVNGMYNPIQYDYQLLHASNNFSSDVSSRRIHLIKSFLSNLPSSFQNYIYGNYELWTYSFRNKTFFKPWEEKIK